MRLPAPPLRPLLLCAALAMALALGAQEAPAPPPSAPQAPAAPAALVTLRPVANLHREPSEDAEVISQTLLGARLTELERGNGWVRVRCDDAYSGWVQAAALRALEPGERYPDDREPSRVAEVDALAANLYREPDVTKHAPVATLPYGARLERTGLAEGARWLQVRLPDRRLAWVQAGDLRGDLRPLDLPASLALAKRFLGVTYTWGGTSSFGLDCSGFTQLVLRSRGLLMPRDARVQVLWEGLAPVAERSDLRPGDLLFFGRDLPGVNHTGMVLEGDRFIHDTPKDRPGVQVSSLSEPYWSRLLVAMRRPK